MGKLFCNILENRLQKWLNDNYPIVDEQAGFRKSYCTSDNIFILHSIVSNYLAHKQGRLYIAFIDFEKAFDRIDHYCMFYKLLKCGARCKFYKTLWYCNILPKAGKNPYCQRNLLSSFLEKKPLFDFTNLVCFWCSIFNYLFSI